MLPELSSSSDSLASESLDSHGSNVLQDIMEYLGALRTCESIFQNKLKEKDEKLKEKDELLSKLELKILLLNGSE